MGLAPAQVCMCVLGGRMCMYMCVCTHVLWCANVCTSESVYAQYISMVDVLGCARVCLLFIFVRACLAVPILHM